MGHLLTSDKKWSLLYLEFFDSSLEAEYRRYDKESSSSSSRLALLLSPILYFGYSLFDYALLKPECHPMVYTRLVTVLCMSPFFALVWHKPGYATNQTPLTFLGFIYGLTMCWGAYLYDQQYTLYFVTGLVMTNTYCALLLPMRLKQTAISIALLSAICFMIVINKSDDHILRLTSFHILFTMGLFLTCAVYRLEAAKRKQFVKQLELLNNQSQLAKSESQRANWLENTTNFLRHELRNSIRGISSSVEMFKRFNPELADNKYLKRSEQSIQVSNRLLSNVGNATQLESQLNNEERYNLDLNELINDYVNVIAPSSKSNQVEFIANNEAYMVRANSERLIQALDNLLSNAFDYASPGSSILIKLNTEKQFAIVSVENKGAPLPIDKSTIFDAFVSKRGSENHTPNNMGVGLYIVKAIIQSYGGEILAEDLPNNSGARFSFTLPIYSEH